MRPPIRPFDCETSFRAQSKLWKLYYHANGRPIALRVLPPGNNTGTLYFLHQDYLGSTSAVTCGSGSCGEPREVVAQQWYHPYGSVRAITGTLPTDITFTGQRSDATGLYFYNARYYSPLIGRFVSADSIVPEPGNPQALNRYSYSLSNPIKYIDPSGHASTPSCAGQPDCGVDNTPAPINPCQFNRCVDLGIWHLTMYNYALESETPTDPIRFGKADEIVTINVCFNGGGGCEQRTFPYRFLYGAEGIIMQGTGKTRDGRYVHPGDVQGYWVYATGPNGKTYKDYFVPTVMEVRWGPGRNLTPHVSVATGAAYPFGTALYVPDLAHAPNGGVFRVADRGGGIENGDMDIFIGSGWNAYKSSATYYFGAGHESANMRVYQIVLTVDQQFGSMK